MKQESEADKKQRLAKLADIATWTVILVGSSVVVYVIYTGLSTIFSV